VISNLTGGFKTQVHNSSAPMTWGVGGFWGQNLRGFEPKTPAPLGAGWGQKGQKVLDPRPQARPVKPFLTLSRIGGRS